MQAMEMDRAGASRLHIVFVPGFGGFDALGQFEYYTGTTRAFREWTQLGAAQATAGARAVLHYFPNLPTAGVRTRAALLGRYLAKRELRNDIQPQDRIVLIGHSTGGLDIRQLLLELDGEQRDALRVAGNEDEADSGVATGRSLLQKIERVVFLSVPQRGTNIANWVKSYGVTRDMLVGALRRVVDALDAPLVDVASSKAGILIDRVRDLPSARAVSARLPGLVVAAVDANAELAERTSPDPLAAALSRTALFDLNLWLSHTHGDFLAVDDLAASEPTPSGLTRLTEPLAELGRAAYRAARFELRARRSDQVELTRCTEAARDAERAMWRREGIAVRSYATRAPAPFDREPREPARLRSLPEVLWLGGRPDADTDVAYRLVHTACSTGPFIHSMVETSARSLIDGSAVRVAAWDNDGIVNTGSMLWPSGEDTLLVDADHADIIGHYRLAPNDRKEARRYHRYDIFQSGAGFHEGVFTRIWNDIFDFCTDARPEVACQPEGSRARP